MYAEDMEGILNAAGELDDQLHYAWMEFIGDDEYQTLMAFFDKENFYDTWEDEPRSPEDWDKRQKRVLVGKDRVQLIRYAFDLGHLVGRAEQLLRDKED